MYEYDYCMCLYEKVFKEKLAKMKHIFRYKDELLAVKNDGLLGSIFSEIYIHYPDEMAINKTNIPRCKSNF